MRGSSGGTRHRDLIATLNDKRGTRTVITADYDKAPGGCKGDWTNPQGLPRRGESPMGWRRVNR